MLQEFVNFCKILVFLSLRVLHSWSQTP